MFTVNSTIKLNFGAIKRMSKNAQTALEQTTDAFLTELKNAQVMPRRDGDLQNEYTSPDYTNSAKGQTSIVSDTPYARRLYFHPEYNFHRDVWTDSKGRKHGGNKAAGAKWFRYWQAGGTRENFCVETFAQIYRRLNKS